MINRRMMMNDKIVTQFGKQLILEKCKGSYLNGLNVYGKSTQAKTTGAQLLNLKNGAYTVNGVTAAIKDGELKLSGTATANGGRTIQLSDPFLLKQGTYIGTLCKNFDAILSALDNSHVATISSGQSFTISEDTEVYFGINVHESKAYAESVFIMLNSGETLEPYEPYTGGKPSPSPEYPQEIKIAGRDGKIKVHILGKNFFDVSKVSDVSTTNGSIVNNDGVLTVTTSNSDSSVYTGRSLAEVCHGIVPDKTYALDLVSSGTQKSIYISESRIVWSAKTSKVLQADVIRNFFKFYASGTNTTAEISNIQIELGSTATDYEPYKPAQTLTLATPNGLAGIPVKSGGNYTDENGQQWITDEIDCDRGVRIQRVIKLIFDGSDDDNWSTYNNYAEYAGFQALRVLPEPMDRREGYCNVTAVRSSTSSVLNNGIWIGVQSTSVYYANNPFYDDSLEDKGLANWKTYLAENPMEVITYVTTPIETILTPAEIAAYKALHTYSPNTTVTNDSDCGMAIFYRKIRHGGN